MVVGELRLRKAQRKIYELLQSYFKYCESEGYTEFEIWCEDNIDCLEEKMLLDKIYQEVNYVADKLFDLRK